MDSHRNRRRISPAAIVLAPLACALVVTLFAWPSSRLSPRDLPVGVAGPASAAQQVERKLDSDKGAFEVHRYADEASARQAIEDRDVYGAVVVEASGPKVLTASAASTSVAQLLTKAAGAESAPVEGVVPAPSAATGLSSSVFPLILTGSLLAALAGLLATDGRRRAVLIVAGSALAGAAANGLVQSWLGIVDGRLGRQRRRARADDRGDLVVRRRDADAVRAGRRSRRRPADDPDRQPVLRGGLRARAARGRRCAMRGPRRVRRRSPCTPSPGRGAHADSTPPRPAPRVARSLATNPDGDIVKV
jgi:hypothetical protein